MRSQNQLQSKQDHQQGGGALTTSQVSLQTNSLQKQQQNE